MNHSELKDFFLSYSKAWTANSAAEIFEHWDQAEPAPFYKAEEISHYFHTFDEIQSYWRHNETFHDSVRLEFSDFHAKPLTEELSMVFVRMRWDIKFAVGTKTQDGAAFAHSGKQMGGENHVLTLIRTTPRGHRLIGWSETPDAPITYMARLYQWAAQGH